jgi:Family of unknown function (DUF5706)
MGADTPDADVRLETANRNLDRILGSVSNADNKALIFLTFDGVIAGALSVTGQPLLAALTAPRPDVTRWVVLGLAALFALLFLTSVGSTMLALVPSVSTKDEDGEKLSPFFFGAISRMSRQQFISAYESLDAAQVERELLIQIYINSGIVTRKYAHIRRAVILLAQAALVFAIALTCALLTAR